MVSTDHDTRCPLPQSNPAAIRCECIPSALGAPAVGFSFSPNPRKA